MMQKELDSLKGEYEGVKLSSEMTRLQTDLKAEYGDLVTDEYMKSIQERAKSEKLSTSTLKEIADGHLAKEQLKANKTNVKQVSKEAEAKAIQKLAETKKSAPQSPKQVGGSPKQESSTDGSWSDFLKRNTK